MTTEDKKKEIVEEEKICNNHWHKFIEQCQTACPLSSCGGLHKMFLGTISSNQYPDDKDSDLNPPTHQQV